MSFLKVLMGIGVLLVLLLLVPVGVDVSFCEGKLCLYLRIWSMTVCLYPPKEKKKPQKKKADPAASEPNKEKPKKFFPDVTKDEVLDGVTVIVRGVKKLRFRLHRLKLHFVSAFADPYQTAMVFGYANGAACALGLDRVKHGDVQIGVDFEREQCYFDGYLSVTIRIWYICKLGCSLLWGGIPILLSRRKRLKTQRMGAVQGKEA